MSLLVFVLMEGNKKIEKELNRGDLCLFDGKCDVLDAILKYRARKKFKFEVFFKKFLSCIVCKYQKKVDTPNILKNMLEEM